MWWYGTATNPCRSCGPLHPWPDGNGRLPFGVLEVKFDSEVYAAF